LVQIRLAQRGVKLSHVGGEGARHVRQRVFSDIAVNEVTLLFATTNGVAEILGCPFFLQVCLFGEVLLIVFVVA
jgi:hypothetical protein